MAYRSAEVIIHIEEHPSRCNVKQIVTIKIKREPLAVHVLRLTFRYLANARLLEYFIHRGVRDLEAFSI